MYNLRITFCLLLMCCLTLELVSSQNTFAFKDNTSDNRAKEARDSKSKTEKRDSQKQEATKNNNKFLQQPFSNDEPFRPIYRLPNPQQYNAAPKYISHAIAPHAELMNTGKIAVNAPETPANAVTPSFGSYISDSGNGRHVQDAYRVPLKPVVYEYRTKPPSNVQQKEKTSNIALTTQKVNGQHRDSAYVEPVMRFLFDRAASKLPQQKGEQIQQPQQQQPPQKQRLILQPLHQHHQPHIQFYNPHQHQSTNHQQFNARAIPQKPHFQYIIAIPLSYVRQLQQQQQQQQHEHQLAARPSPTSLGQEIQISALNPEISVTAQPLIGPLARDHYGLYRQVHYTSNRQAQHVGPSGENQNTNHNPQYTTQYIQIPTNVVYDAIQAAHVYQNRQQEHEQPRISFQNSQPQQTYNIYQQQQPQENEQEQRTQHQALIYAHPAQEKTQSQEAIIHVGGSNPSARNIPTKAIDDNSQIPAIQNSTTPFAALVSNSIVSPTDPVGTKPIVHYNPIYVQGPPPEQQSLFGTLNYHRFATGGFHATTPLPFVRLSAPPSQNYYTSIPHHLHHYPHQLHPHQQHYQHEHHQPQLQPHHRGLEYKTMYSSYASEQIPHIADGLPYFTHPGGVHYGTHLYHPAPTFFGSPSIPPKDAQTTSGHSFGNQHQQSLQQQHRQNSHVQFVTPLPYSDESSSPSLLKANVAAIADRNAYSR